MLPPPPMIHHQADPFRGARPPLTEGTVGTIYVPNELSKNLDGAMFNLLKNLVSCSASPSAAPRESVPAGHGLQPSLSKLVPGTLPPGRRGRLKNCNRPGDFLAAPRCGARTRCGGACRQPAMRNGRCRMHGGLSTGPRTPEGLARSRRARLTHGGYSAHVRELRAAARAHGRRVRALLALIHGRPAAGHGVHPSNLPTTGPVLVLPKVHHGEHRDHRGPNPPALRATRNHPSSVSSVVTPSSAGHGLHPSFFTPARPAGLRAHLRSSAAPTLIAAGHGLHLSFFDGRPALR